MNVYVWTSGTLKNAYIGKVIYKYIDVRWKTLAQIQAEWWWVNNGNWSYTLDSNWISVSTQNAWANLYYPISLTNAKKITLRYTWNCTSPWSSSYWWWAMLWISDANNSPSLSDMGNFLFGIYQSWGNSWWKGTNIRLWFNNILSTTLWNNTAGNIDETFVIDLDTWALTYSINWPVTWTTSATLTSSQLAQVKQYWYICFTPIEWSGGYYMRLYTAEFTIE